MKKGEIRDVELKIMKKDGSAIDASMNVTAIYDEKGKIVKMYIPQIA